MMMLLGGLNDVSGSCSLVTVIDKVSMTEPENIIHQDHFMNGISRRNCWGSWFKEYPSFCK